MIEGGIAVGLHHATKQGVERNGRLNLKSLRSRRHSAERRIPETDNELADVTGCIERKADFQYCRWRFVAPSQAQAARPAPVLTSAMPRLSVSSVGKVNWK